MTHPFHPLSGQTFEAAACQRGWADERVWFVLPDGRARSLPLTWTDLAPPDPYLVVGASRSLFRVEDLLQLATLLQEVRR